MIHIDDGKGAEAVRKQHAYLRREDMLEIVIV